MASAQAGAVAVKKDTHPFDRAALEAILLRRFFFAPAFEIYGGKLPLPS